MSFPQLFTYNENKSEFVFESLSLQIGYNELVSNMLWKFVLSDTFVHRYSIYKIAVLTFRGNSEEITCDRELLSKIASRRQPYKRRPPSQLLYSEFSKFYFRWLLLHCFLSFTMLWDEYFEILSVSLLQNNMESFKFEKYFFIGIQPSEASEAVVRRCSSK